MFDYNVLYGSTNPTAAMVLFMLYESLMGIVMLNILIGERPPAWSACLAARPPACACLACPPARLPGLPACLPACPPAWPARLPAWPACLPACPPLPAWLLQQKACAVARGPALGRGRCAAGSSGAPGRALHMAGVGAGLRRPMPRAAPHTCAHASTRPPASPRAQP
jgi:hypothetical protein